MRSSGHKVSHASIAIYTYSVIFYFLQMMLYTILHCLFLLRKRLRFDKSILLISALDNLLVEASRARRLLINIFSRRNAGGNKITRRLILASNICPFLFFASCFVASTERLDRRVARLNTCRRYSTCIHIYLRVYPFAYLKVHTLRRIINMCPLNVTLEYKIEYIRVYTS